MEVKTPRRKNETDIPKLTGNIWLEIFYCMSIFTNKKREGMEELLSQN